MIDLNAAVAGLLAGLTLIVAIGAQNAYVLRQGLRREAEGLRARLKERQRLQHVVGSSAAMQRVVDAVLGEPPPKR